MKQSPRYNFRYPELTDQVSAFPPDVAAQNALLLDQVIGSLTDNTNTALAGKAPTSHTHTTGQVTGLDTALAGKAPTSHTHTMGQVTGLDTALAGKAPTSHTHTMGQVTGLDTALAAKANQAALDTRVPSTLALQLDNTVGKRILIGNTMVFGDTGRRDISALFSEPLPPGNVFISIANGDIHLYFNYAQWPSAVVTCQLPSDWGAFSQDWNAVFSLDGITGYVEMGRTGLLTVKRSSVATALRGGVRFRAKTWPAAQVGIPG